MKSVWLVPRDPAGECVVLTLKVHGIVYKGDCSVTAHPVGKLCRKKRNLPLGEKQSGRIEKDILRTASQCINQTMKGPPMAVTINSGGRCNGMLMGQDNLRYLRIVVGEYRLHGEFLIFKK
jgi:hypothetical protein